MKNNQGFTLIELIVVIAIMGIIAGISSNSLSSVSNQELKDFVNAYDAMLSECKVETMSGMSDPMLEIMLVEKDGNDEYEAVLYETVMTNNIPSKTKVKEQYLGEDYLTLTCTYTYLAENGALKEQKHNGVLSIAFDHSTGEIEVWDNATKLSDSLKISLITFSVSNGRSTYSVELIPATGYHRIVH